MVGFVRKSIFLYFPSISIYTLYLLYDIMFVRIRQILVHFNKHKLKTRFDDQEKTVKKQDSPNILQFASAKFYGIADDYARFIEKRQLLDETLWRKFVRVFSECSDIQDDGYYQVKAERCPENYGFNVIKLSAPEAGTTVTADFKGLQGEDVAPNGCPGYDNAWYYIPYYRYGFVGVTEDGETVLGTSGSTDYYNQTSTVSWTVPSDQKLAYLWLVVTAGPSTDHWTLSALPMAQWPYKVKLTNTSIQ